MFVLNEIGDFLDYILNILSVSIDHFFLKVSFFELFVCAKEHFLFDSLDNGT
jgi:hypothetical protein